MGKGNEAAYARSNGGNCGSSTGLTKREYFAGLAMQGICANPVALAAIAQSVDGDNDAGQRKVAGYALAHADALLTALERSHDGG